MNKCPVCKNDICNIKHDGLCLKCGWDFRYYTAGMTRSEEIRFKKKLKIARRNWKTLISSIKETRTLKNRIDNILNRSSH